jgi:putative flippase GtrA
MTRSIPSLVRTAAQNEQIRYLAVAGSTTLVYLGLLAALLTVLPYMLAILVAQAVIISVAFPTYRRLIFRSTRPWRQDLPRFVGVWAGGLLAGVVATPLLVELVGMPPLPAQVLAVVVVAVLSYLGHRFISFRTAG